MIRPYPLRTRAAWIVFVALATLVSPAHAANETWSEVITSAGPPARADLAGAFDPVGGRMIVFGGYEQHGQTWALTPWGSPHWDLISSPTPPPGRHGASMVYDPVRQRMLLFGGYGANSYRNDVWALSLGATPNWSQVATTGTPPSGRMYSVVVYDPIGDRLLVMGGHPSLLNDVWALQLGGANPQWSPVTVTSSAPSPRYGHVGVFDTMRNRLVIWGGEGAIDNTVWTLSLGGPPTWTSHSIPSTPSNRILPTAVHDPANDRMLIFGGSPATNQVWSLLLGPMNWEQLAVAGESPSPRWAHASAVDLNGSQMLTFGGYTSTVPTLTATTYSLTWEPSGPTIIGFNPTGGLPGEAVTISGLHLESTTLVRFNGVDAPIVSASPFTVETIVPAGATTGLIQVTTPAGVAVSSAPFIIGATPSIASFSPDSGYVDDEVVIRGTHFTGAHLVAIGNATAVPFTVVSDTVIVATVTSISQTGPILVANSTGARTSVASFKLLSPYPPPRIVSVRDVKADQGGKVTIKWIRSENDGVSGSTVRSYRIWRRALSDASLRNGAASLKQISATGAIEFWEEVGTVAAARLSGYSFTAPTPQDSIAGSNPYSAFFIQALTENVSTFYSSRVDSGYSVDNLSPPAPAPFIAVYTPTGTALHWTPSRAPDFAIFQLHRGASADFVPGVGNLVSAQPDTGYFDPAGGSLYFYKLAAVDLHGNVGRHALVTPMGPTAALATAIEARFDDDRVRIRWYVSAEVTGECAVERQSADGFWFRLGTVAPDGNGYVHWEDASVTRGESYMYRLVLPTEDGEVRAGEIAIDVPGDVVDEAIRIPNPVYAGDITVSLRLPVGRTVAIDLVDVSGRIVATREVAGEGERRVVTVTSSDRLAPGLYFLRFSGLSIPARRVVVVR